MGPFERNPRDLVAGVLYLTIGLAAVYFARDYPMGRLGRMGPGYFPTVLGWILAAFGILSLVRGLMRRGEAISEFAWKPLVLVVTATLAFGVLLEPAGALVALATLIYLSAAASRRFTLDPRALLGAIGLIGFCLVVFVVGLGVPMPIFGTWLER